LLYAARIVDGCDRATVGREGPIVDVAIDRFSKLITTDSVQTPSFEFARLCSAKQPALVGQHHQMPHLGRVTEQDRFASRII
jgi:hypothetical protein